MEKRSHRAGAVRRDRVTVTVSVSLQDVLVEVLARASEVGCSQGCQFSNRGCRPCRTMA